MKVKLVLAAVVSVCALTLAKADVSNTNEQNVSGELLACGWFPLCGDPDVYSPDSTSKDSKTSTDTQGTKNEKLA